MAKFTSDNQPQNTGRGKSEKTKFLDALKEKGKTEEGFYELCIERAFDPDDNFAFKEVLGRLSPLKKSVAPMIEFEFPENATPYIQAAAIIKAMSNGEIPPDLGQQCITALSAMMKIKEVTDIDERLKKMESHLEQD
jgi:hypothetical protein